MYFDFSLERFYNQGRKTTIPTSHLIIIRPLFDTSRLQFRTSVSFILPPQYLRPSLCHQSETIDNQ
jgi:hypothetical protein